ncbi:RICIN domain-containing protein [Bifidobacterium adolescentis]|uniref:RICIN domain-containing protein n=1 Tax=Bifidobacterium adolescentis TaxID=1680 RepID=UPI003CE4F716
MTRAERRRAARKARAVKTWKKVAAGTVAVATLFGGMGVASTALAADRDSYQDTIGNSSFEAARQQYGLTKHMKNGAILHAWMWSFKNITANMEAIAKAGYTSVQTEPMSKIKFVPSNGKKFDENWYYVYQPANTSIGNFVVGSEDDLKEMTATAHKYGVRVIVDVVANHFTSDWSAIDSDWQNTDYFHKRTGCDGPNGEIKDYSNRYKVTQCHLLGLWDLNTQSQTVADRMQSFLKTAVADGVDGFRYDAAKHVELPSEVFDNKKSNYWNTILKNGSQFQYGEVLQGDSGLDYKAYANMFSDNSSDGGGNTASAYGGTVRAAISSGNLSTKMVQSISTGGASEDQLVTWVESHDNYANKEQTGSDGVKKGVSTELTDYELMMGWAIVGSRKAGAPLYFNRPKESGGKDANGNIRPQFAEKSQLGDTGDDMWKNTSVVAVNHFRNAMDGKSEYLQNCGDKSCLMIERFTKDKQANDGVTIANMGGEQNLAGMSTNLDDGTYPDEVNGGKLVVKNGKIESGTAKANSVSVFYVKGKVLPYVSAEPASIDFSTDSVKVTLHAVYASNLKYTTSEGKTGTFQDGDVISVGSSLSVGQSATITVTGTASKTVESVQQGTALSNKVTVNKVDVPPQNLAVQYGTNKVGNGVKKTINFTAGKDASIADWDSSMLIAQGAANDDPRVYRPNSMYEVPIDLYALYGAYDDDNLYLMWEMTNVQDVVDTGDDYPLSQGHLWQTQNLPFHIAIDTKDDSTRIGNNGGLQTGGSLWASNITWGGEQKLNNVVTISTNGSNGPWIYKGDETGLNSKAAYGPAANAATNTKKSNIKFGYGNGILSKDVIGIDGGWGENNGRFIGDMKAENQNKAKWVNFNEKGHNSAQMDDHYEIAIPLEEIGTTADRIASSGIGIELAATFGLSAVDSLPYDLAMNDNADLPDTGSQVNNSFEKSDDDMFSVKMANIGGEEPPVETKSVDQSDYSVDLSNGVTTKQLTATTDPKGASVSWSSSNKDVATVSPKGVVTPRKAGKATITAKSGTKTSSITVTVTGQLPPDPVAKNTIYAAKPSGWGKIYAYVYTGDGATAANNAAWPGVEMTATTATDGCKQSGYKYEVPDNLAKGAKVIFNDGGSQQYPGSRQPGLDYNGGIVKWDGSSAALGAVECETTIPVTSVSISGDGVSGGKLSLKSGASAQLTATVKPDDATDRKVTWTSSDSSVANVMGTGVVTAGSKAGRATVTATAGGKSASVEVTVEAQNPYAELDALAKAHASDLADGTYVVSTALKDGMLLDVAGGSKKDGGNVLIYTATGGANQQWRVSHDPKGYVTLSNVNSGKVLDVAGGSARNGANALQYSSTGGRNQKWVAVRSGSSYRLVSAMSQSLVLDVAGWSTKNGTNVDVWTSNGGANQQWKFKSVGQSQKSATVWYRPSSAQSRVRVQWRVYGSPDTTGGTEMTKACGGWWKATVPSAGSTKVGLSFSYGSTSDDNGGKLYDVKGESAAVSGGQAVTDVTPNCVATAKQ